MTSRGLAVAVLLVAAGCSSSSSEPPSPTVVAPISETSPATGSGSVPTPAIVRATEFSLQAPESLLFDEQGNLYVSEFEGHRVVRVDAAGYLKVVAGIGLPGFSGDGGPATTAELDSPCGLVFTQSGDLIVVDHGNGRIRAIAPDGTIRTIAGNGRTPATHGLSNGSERFALKARLDDPIGIALDKQGDLILADELNGLVREISADGRIATLAGGGIASGDVHDRVLATDLSLEHPSYVVILSDGDVAFSDNVGNAIWEVDAHGRASRIAGTGVGDYSGDGGPATDAELNFPTGMALGPDGVLYVSDADNNVVRAIDLSAGTISTVAGTGDAGFSGEGGPATQAQLNAPAGLAFDAQGNLFIADQGNDVVRRVDSSGTITTIAGLLPA
jgi:sugar lactone lactonase YvrE